MFGKKSKKTTVDHLVSEKIPERTVYSIISTFKNTNTTDDKPRSGRPRKLARKS